MQLTLTVLEKNYAICKLPPTAVIPDWAHQGEFYSVTKTADELSIVCSQEYVGDIKDIDKGWRIFKIEGKLDFSLLGIIASLSSVLAKEGVSVLVISTFDTDYILVKEDNLEKSINLLVQARHTVNTVNKEGL